MANSKNLKPFTSEQSREEAKKNGKKGGKKSGEVRRAKKTMKEMLDYLLEKEISNKQGDKASTQEAISVALIKQALNGNVKAYEVIRDTIGQKPKDKQELTGDLNVQKVFVTPEMHQATLEHIKQVINDQ